MNGATYCHENDVQSCDLILPISRFYFVFFFQLLSKFGCCCLVAKHVWLFATPWIVCSPLLCPWDFPSKNPRVSCHSLLHGIFPTQGSNQDLLHCRWILSQLNWGASLVAQLVKNLPAMQEILVWSLGWEDPLEKGKAAHSSILAWRIPWTV